MDSSMLMVAGACAACIMSMCVAVYMSSSQLSPLDGHSLDSAMQKLSSKIQGKTPADATPIIRSVVRTTTGSSVKISFVSGDVMETIDPKNDEIIWEVSSNGVLNGGYAIGDNVQVRAA